MRFVRSSYNRLVDTSPFDLIRNCALPLRDTLRTASYVVAHCSAALPDSPTSPPRETKVLNLRNRFNRGLPSTSRKFKRFNNFVLLTL